MGDSKWIIGGSLLFAGCGAEPPSAPELDGSVRSDVSDNLDAGQLDTGQVDAAIGLDAGAADWGLPPEDAGTPPQDAGSPPRDAGRVDPPYNGQPCETRDQAFCARNQAQFWCTGTHWQRTDSFRCDPCNGPDGYGHATCHQPQNNEGCLHPNQAYCSATLEPATICMGEQWYDAEAVGFCGPCELDQQGYLVSYCAVPGFVGLAQAGRKRSPGQALRPE